MFGFYLRCALTCWNVASIRLDGTMFLWRKQCQRLRSRKEDEQADQLTQVNEMIDGPARELWAWPLDEARVLSLPTCRTEIMTST